MAKNKTFNKTDLEIDAKPAEEVVSPESIIETVPEPISDAPVSEEVQTISTFEEASNISEDEVVDPDFEVIPPVTEGGEGEDLVSVDIVSLNKIAKLEAVRTGTISTVMDRARSSTILVAKANFKYFMECKNPGLKKFNPMGAVAPDGAQLLGNMTPEEEIYFMENNFDWFSINGTLLVNKGEMIGTSGMYMPTGNNFVVCTVKQFADIIGYEPDGSNWGIHKISYNDSSVRAWYKTKITKYNLSKFIVAYCEGTIARMDGVGALSAANRAELMEIAEKFKKFDSKDKK